MYAATTSKPDRGCCEGDFFAALFGWGDSKQRQPTTSADQGGEQRRQAWMSQLDATRNAGGGVIYPDGAAGLLSPTHLGSGSTPPPPANKKLTSQRSFDRMHRAASKEQQEQDLAQTLARQAHQANEAGDSARAVQLFQQAHALDTKMPNYLISAGNMHLKLNEPAEAVEAYTRCSTLQLTPYQAAMLAEKLGLARGMLAYQVRVASLPSAATANAAPTPRAEVAASAAADLGATLATAAAPSAFLAATSAERLSREQLRGIEPKPTMAERVDRVVSEAIVTVAAEPKEATATQVGVPLELRWTLPCELLMCPLSTL